jgi:hypothetical protein
MDPGSAAHHAAKGGALRSIRGTPTKGASCYTTTLSRFAARVMPV